MFHGEICNLRALSTVLLKITSSTFARDDRDWRDNEITTSIFLRSISFTGLINAID